MSLEQSCARLLFCGFAATSFSRLLQSTAMVTVRPPVETILPQPRKRRHWVRAVAILVFVFVIMPLTILALIPVVFTSCARDARRAEGEQMMGSMKSLVRQYFQDTGRVPLTLTELGVKKEELDGKYYDLEDRVSFDPVSRLFSMKANPETDSDGYVVFHFSPDFGDGTFEWEPDPWFKIR